jgi:4-amino-4-deoxychorismate lyase
MRILVNGEEGAGLSATDRGFQFGDGVFETLRVHNGRPLLWERHWARLCRGLDQLGIPRIRESACLADLENLSRATECMVKLIVTRGPGARGYAAPVEPRPTRVAMGGEPLASTTGAHPLRIGLCRTRVGTHPLGGCKHLNRIENVLARMEWGADWDEGLMLDASGRAICGTQSNLFVVEKETLVTPPIRRSGIAGTRRGWLLEHARREGISVREEPLPLARVRAADALFLSNARIGLCGAVWVDSPTTGPRPGTSLGLLDDLRSLGAQMHALA